MKYGTSSGNEIDINSINVDTKAARVTGMVYTDKGSSDNSIAIKDVTIKSSDWVILSGYATNISRPDRDTVSNVHFRAKKDSKISIDTGRVYLVGLYHSNGSTKLVDVSTEFNDIDIRANGQVDLNGLVRSYTRTGGMVKNASVFLGGNISIASNQAKVVNGLMGEARRSEISNASVQIARPITLRGNTKDGISGFIGESRANISDSFALIFGKLDLEDSDKAVGFVADLKSGSIKNSAVYLGEGLKGNLGFVGKGNSSSITGSTLLKNEGDVTVFTDPNEVEVDESNFVVEVKDGNRKAYKLVKQGEAYTKGTMLGELYVVDRSFQNSYWGKLSKDLGLDYPLSNSYIKNPTANFTVIGVDKSIVLDGASKIKLDNYHNRQAAIRGEDGATYDLVGIKGSKFFNLKYSTIINGVEKLDVDPKDYLEGQKIHLPDKKHDREGYSFLGWTKDINGKTHIYKVGDEFEISEDMTFYAKYQENPKLDIVIERKLLGGITLGDIRVRLSGDDGYVKELVINKDIVRVDGLKVQDYKLEILDSLKGFNKLVKSKLVENKLHFEVEIEKSKPTPEPSKDPSKPSSAKVVPTGVGANYLPIILGAAILVSIFGIYFVYKKLRR